MELVPVRPTAALVRFTPGARTNWHSHAVGQTLYATTWLEPVADEQYQADQT